MSELKKEFRWFTDRMLSMQIVHGEKKSNLFQLGEIFKNVAIIVNATKVYETENLINKWEQNYVECVPGKNGRGSVLPTSLF